MRRPSASGSAATCGALLLLILLGSARRASTPVIATVVTPILLSLLANELDRSGGLIARPIVRLASWLLPRNIRTANADEWQDHVLCAGEQGLRPVGIALQIALITAPRIALRSHLRPAAGRYLLALVDTALDVLAKGPRGKSRAAEWISLGKALIRISALPALPALALLTMRRHSVPPRWLTYAIGTLALLVQPYAIPRSSPLSSFWIQSLAAMALVSVELAVGVMFIIKSPVLKRVGIRLTVPPDQ